MGQSTNCGGDLSQERHGAATGGEIGDADAGWGIAWWHCDCVGVRSISCFVVSDCTSDHITGQVCSIQLAGMPPPIDPAIKSKKHEAGFIPYLVGRRV